MVFVAVVRDGAEGAMAEWECGRVGGSEVAVCDYIMRYPCEYESCVQSLFLCAYG